MVIKQKTHAKQNSIIESSIALFLKYTAKKTSMDEIAATAHVSKVTVYKYFQNKNGLYWGVYSHIEDGYNSDISRQVHHAAPVIQKMINYIEIYTAFIGSGHLELCEELSQLSSSVRERFEAFQAGNEKLIMQIISEAGEQGLIRSNLDSDVVFHYINMGLSYYRHDDVYRSRMRSDASFRQAYMELMFKNIFNDCSALE